ncbi:hypothetical protein KIPB_001444 [Kipferlia bialata]|uniref:Leucine--tRNA ligase RagD-binding domain-containing protein n=1 Tax=Kipferlia bialata TaxID=797122 RepID=A0A9K3CQM2_9EUKA|nr:hypothetical protein KIPB_001444 [Kipferlia bialata]|eukprot:g1444.t1
MYVCEGAQVFRIRAHQARFPAQQKGKKGKKAPAPAQPSEVNHARIYVARNWAPWQTAILETLASVFDAETKTWTADVMKTVKAIAGVDERFPKMRMKKGMAFAAEKRRLAESEGVSALASTFGFDEADVLRQYEDYLKSTIQVESVTVYVSGEGEPGPEDKNAHLAIPGKPIVYFS